jgi:hypothetical protein
MHLHHLDLALQHEQFGIQMQLIRQSVEELHLHLQSESCTLIEQKQVNHFRLQRFQPLAAWSFDVEQELVVELKEFRDRPCLYSALILFELRHEH